MMKQGVSIVICCYNSATRLPETLRHLGCQSSCDDPDWEVIIVDNASTDNTTEIAKEACPESIKSRLRLVAEPKSGLSNARICGLHASQYSLVSFIDDDNWVSPDWIKKINTAFATDSKLGALGGPALPVYESPPPPWMSRIKGFYALGEQHAHDGDITDAEGTLLWGAGLTIRREALIKLFERGFEFLMSDRQGSRLSTGGDTEICFGLRAMGWSFRYDSQITLQHFVPSSRLTWEYACNLMYGMGCASVVFTIYLIAFGKMPFDHPSLMKRKGNWNYQFLKSIKKIMELLLFNPSVSWRKKEGCDAEIKYQILKGVLSSLLSNKKKYTEYINKIQNASWNLENKYKMQ
jgi:glycosyltransferase involved in cell wall biosynthesis